jgi:signal transduction histidine kinase
VREFYFIILGIIIGLALMAPAALVVRRRAARRARAGIRKALTDQRLTEIGSLSQGLAHEIKNPLSTIGLNAQLLMESVEALPIDGEDREPLTRRLGSLGREVERLRDILEDFLNYAGEIRIEPRRIDLNELVAELADFYSPQAQSKSVRLVTALDPSMPGCLADPSSLKQAILNLMINATDAMSKNADGEDRVLNVRTLQLRDDEGELVCGVRVEDSGPGVKPENSERIFQPYFTTRKSGAGLGLAITKRLIEEQAGTIELTPSERAGAVFTIALPVAST